MYTDSVMHVVDSALQMVEYGRDECAQASNSKVCIVQKARMLRVEIAEIVEMTESYSFTYWDSANRRNRT